MRLTSKKIFYIAYFFMIFGLFVDQTSFFPFREVFVKIKYVYLIWCFIDLFILSKKKVFSFNKNITFIGLLLCCYTFLFGIVFTKDIVATEINNNLILMTFYYLILFFTYAEIKKYKCLDNFVLINYFCVTLFLMICLFTHLNEMTINPLFLFRIFISSVQLNSFFGITHKNFVGFFCFIQVVLAFWVHRSKILDRYVKRRIVFFIFEVIVEFLLFLMLISASARGGILSIGVFLLLIGIFKSKNKKIWIGISLFIAAIFIVVAVETPLGDILWNSVHRDSNISGNYEAFQKFGNIWTGMGFVENGAFQTGAANNWTSAWGFKETVSLDMYYPFLYFTTGIIGCVFIGTVLLFILYKLLRIAVRCKRYDCLALYLSILFYSIFETILFTPKLYQMVILLLIIFMELTDYDIENNTEIVFNKKNRRSIGYAYNDNGVF